MARKAGDRNYTPQVVRIIDKLSRKVQRRDRVIERLEAQVNYEKAANRKHRARIRRMDADFRERVAKLKEAVRALKAKTEAGVVTRRSSGTSSVRRPVPAPGSWPRIGRRPRLLGRVLDRREALLVA